MDTMTFMQELFDLCFFPLLSILTAYFVQFLRVKKEEIKVNVKNTTGQKYIDMITDTITKCVIATNQTYTNALKEQNAFDEEAQKQAFEKTFSSVLAILTDDTKEYIKETTGDLNVYLTQLIEAEVNKNREPKKVSE